MYNNETNIAKSNLQSFEIAMVLQDRILIEYHVIEQLTEEHNEKTANENVVKERARVEMTRALKNANVKANAGLNFSFFVF